MNEKIWVEKYRPSKMDDLIVPKDLREKLELIIKDKNVPSIIMCGRPGVGKTTSAKIIANEIGSDVMFINSSMETSIDVLRTKIFDFASTRSFDSNGKTKKVVILDEVENSSIAFFSAFRAFLEQFSSQVTFIMTTNYINKITDPVKSRSVLVEFNFSKEEVQKQTFKRLIEILDAEEITYEKSDVLKTVLKYSNDFRHLINVAQQMSLSGEFDPSVETETSYTELYDILKSKNWSDLRKYVADNWQQFEYKPLFDFLRDNHDNSALPDVVLLISEYQYKQAFVVDVEINTLAFLTQVMEVI